MKYGVGDCVICIKDHPDGNPYLFANQSVGTIIVVEDNYYGVSWEVAQDSRFSRLGDRISTYNRTMPQYLTSRKYHRLSRWYLPRPIDT